MGAKRKYSMTAKEMPQWIEQHPCVKRYLKAVHGRTNRNAQCIYLYCEWAKKTPEELLALKNSLDSPADQLIDDFSIDDRTGIPEATKFKIIYIVKGFYRVNRRQLQAEAGKLEYHTKNETGFPARSQLKTLYENAPERTKPIIMLASTSALAAETLAGLRWSHFESGWENSDIPHISVESELLKGHGFGRYAGVRQETFTTTEGRNALLTYRKWFSETFSYTWQPNDYVFLLTKHNVGGKCTAFILQQAIKEVADLYGTRFHIHDGRRRVQTIMESISCPNNWIKKLKGRKCSGEEAPYSKPAIEQLRAKYREALPELEFLGAQTREQEKKMKDMAADVADLKRFMRELDERLTREKRSL